MKSNPLNPRKSISQLLIVCLALAACHKQGKTNDQINKIEIATAGGLQRSEFIGIQIDSTLILNYYGGYKAKLQGYYSGKVTQGFWDTLNLKLKAINFKKMDTIKYLPMDGQVAEVIFYWSNLKRRMLRPNDDNADSVSNALNWIIDSYRHVQLHKLEDTIKFETNYQHLRPAKRKNYDTVKFPPPKGEKHH